MRGMPLIARRNNKKLNIYNNEMFKCHSIKKETIIVKNEMDEEIEIPFNSIKHFFNIGFCITTHKSQGETYNEDYAIYEWEQMSYTLKYVALSRGTNKNIINIC
jgi:ATP-dependent exoDNAse (exonuclease V) alpha subunit